MDRLIAMGATEEQLANILDQCKRKTGTLRVNLLERYSRALLAQQDKGGR